MPHDRQARADLAADLSVDGDAGQRGGELDRRREHDGVPDREDAGAGDPGGDGRGGDRGRGRQGAGGRAGGRDPADGRVLLAHGDALADLLGQPGEARACTTP